MERAVPPIRATPQVGGADVELAAVTRRYGTGPAAPGLRGVDLQVPAGTFVAITGPSGSGKTTLLNMIAGLDRPDSGTIRVAGSELGSLSADRLASFRLRQVGIVFQSYHLVPELSVFNNVVLPALLAGLPRRESARRVGELLSRVGLAHTQGRRPHELSGGERQRVAIARAMINRPQLIVADEPTGNLDTASGAAVLDLLAQACEQGTTVLLVSHDAAVAARAQSQVRLVDGRIT